MISFVVGAPPANDQIGASILDSLDHVSELTLVFLRFLLLVRARDVKFVLRLWSRGLKGTCKYHEAGVVNGVGHLKMRHVFVDEDTANEGGICERTPDFSIDVDQIGGHIIPIQVGSAMTASTAMRTNFSCSSETLQECS